MAFYVTTPIFYVNAAPHLGHAYTTIAADVMARHMRQRGEDVFFLTGTDEHGEPVALAAEREGVTPRELADRNAERFKALMPQLHASNDFFIRTSDPEHEQRVQEVLQRVHDNGHVYKGVYEGWYCPRCADFKSEAEQGPDHTCPIHEIRLTKEQEENWFFRLSAFQERLEELLATGFVQPQIRANEARAFVAQGLQDVSLTRGKITWGITVPWDPGHVFYVWWDALLNYVTALGYARPGEDLTDRFWGAPTTHLVGKDILKFHTIYWPALLMAADLPVPSRVFVHGFLLGADGRKMSKSLGNVLDPFEVMETFGVDALRFYLMRDVSFGDDGSVSMDGVHQRYTSELANDLGNLASRTIKMVQRYRDGAVPAADLDETLASDFATLHDDVCTAMDAFAIDDALAAIWDRVKRLNLYVEQQQPWQLAKDEARSEDLDRALASLTEGLRVVAAYLLPYLPDRMGTLLDALGTQDRGLRGFGEGERTQQVQTLDPLFPKREIDDQAA
jgi:methionyl-tRNA synthetase